MADTGLINRPTSGIFFFPSISRVQAAEMGFLQRVVGDGDKDRDRESLKDRDIKYSHWYFGTGTLVQVLGEVFPFP